MPSNAMKTYERIRGDLTTLLEYHPALASSIKGRPRKDTGPLLRASLVLLVTAWENYIEEVARECFAALSETVAQDHSLLSTHLRGVIAKAAKADPWAVIDVGWMEIARQDVESQISSLNNASSGQVDALFAKSPGLPGMLEQISWPGLRIGKAREYIIQLVDIHGEIVHMGQALGKLDLDGVKSWLDFLDRLVPRVDSALAVALQSTYGISPPWDAD